MSATLFVFDHPNFAVTEDAGRDHLPPFPPGRYTLRVWHETLGMVTREIDVSTQSRMTIDFSFR